jgi:hypothetical protein
VTDLNKKEYVQAYAACFLIKPWHKKFVFQMRDAFHQLIPALALDSFTRSELFTLVNGAQKINNEGLKRNYLVSRKSQKKKAVVIKKNPGKEKNLFNTEKKRKIQGRPSFAELVDGGYSKFQH